MKPEPARIPVADPTVEKAIDEVRRAVVALARDPMANGRDLVVTLPNGIVTPVRHQLERRVNGYALGAPVGAIAAGYIVETPSTDPASFFNLTANGYGADITIRVRVW